MKLIPNLSNYDITGVTNSILQDAFVISDSNINQ